MRSDRVVILCFVLLFGGCTAASTSGGDLTDNPNGEPVCEPTFSTPLKLTTGSYDEVGTVTVTTSAEEITVVITAASGWELGDTYVGAGPNASSVVWFTANSEPWITGWQQTITVHIPLGQVGLSCDDTFKLLVQIRVRPSSSTDPNAIYLASAYGHYPPDNPVYGWWDYYTICCPGDHFEGCTYTQGFWKTHPEAWPVDHLTIGSVTYDQDALLALLNTPVRGDASLALAHQLIAALLNVAAGATPIEAIDDAQQWMTVNGSGPLPYGIAASTTAGAQATALAAELDAYDQGLAGPPHCGEEPVKVPLPDLTD